MKNIRILIASIVIFAKMNGIIHQDTESTSNCISQGQFLVMQPISEGYGSLDDSEFSWQAEFENQQDIHAITTDDEILQVEDQFSLHSSASVEVSNNSSQHAKCSTPQMAEMTQEVFQQGESEQMQLTPQAEQQYVQKEMATQEQEIALTRAPEYLVQNQNDLNTQDRLDALQVKQSIADLKQKLTDELNYQPIEQKTYGISADYGSTSDRHMNLSTVHQAYDIPALYDSTHDRQINLSTVTPITPTPYSFTPAVELAMEKCSGIIAIMVSACATKGYDYYHVHHLQQVVGNNIPYADTTQQNLNNQDIHKIMAAYTPSVSPDLSSNMIIASLENNASAHNCTNAATQAVIQKALQPHAAQSVDMSDIHHKEQQAKLEAAKIEPIIQAVQAKAVEITTASLKALKDEMVAQYQQQWLASVGQTYKAETQFTATYEQGKVTYTHPGGAFVSFQAHNPAPASIQANSENNIRQYLAMALDPEYKAQVMQAWKSDLRAILRCDGGSTQETLRAYLALPKMHSDSSYAPHLIKARNSLIERFFDSDGTFQASLALKPNNEIRYYAQEFVKNSLDATPGRQELLNRPALRLHKNVSWLKKQSSMSNDLLIRIKLNPHNAIYEKLLAYSDKLDMQSLNAMKTQFHDDPIVQTVVAECQAKLNALMYKDGFIKGCLNDPIYTSLTAGAKAVLRGSPTKMRQFNDELLVRNHIKVGLQQHWSIPDTAPKVVHDALYELMEKDGMALTDVRLLIDKACQLSNKDATVRQALFMPNGIFVGFKEYPCIKSLKIPSSIMSAQHELTRHKLNHLVHQIHMFPDTDRARHATQTLSYLQESLTTQNVVLQEYYTQLTTVAYDAICKDDQATLNLPFCGTKYPDNQPVINMCPEGKLAPPVPVCGTQLVMPGQEPSQGVCLVAPPLIIDPANQPACIQNPEPHEQLQCNYSKGQLPSFSKDCTLVPLMKQAAQDGQLVPATVIGDGVTITEQGVALPKITETGTHAECEAIRKIIINRERKVTIEEAHKLGFRGEQVDTLKGFDKVTGEIKLNTDCQGGIEKAEQMLDSLRKEYESRKLTKKEIEPLENGGQRIAYTFADGSHIQLRSLGKSGHSKIEITDRFKNIKEKITFK